MSIAQLVALFGAGLLTFASPCVLPLLPMYLAVLAGTQADAGGGRSESRLGRAGLGFAVGLGLVFVVLGMGASAIVSTLSEHRAAVEVGAGLLMLVFGAKLVGILRLPWFDREVRPLLERVPSGRGFGGGMMFGAAFAIGWTPCVGPVLGAALTYAATATASPVVAASMLAAYAMGIAAPLVAASFAASKLLTWARRLGRYTPVTQRVSGVLMMVVGGVLASSQLSSFTPRAGSDEACDTGATACQMAPAEARASDTNEGRLPQGPTMVEFTSGHCTVCARMFPIVTELEERCGQGSIHRVSVDDWGGRMLADHYRVAVVPTFLTIDASGVEVQRDVGERTKQELLVTLSEIRGEPCEARL